MASTNNAPGPPHGDVQGRSEAVLAVTIVMIVLCSIFVFFRMLSRVAIVRKITVDDYFMVIAWAIATGLSIAICYGCAYGLGRHEVDVPDSWQSGLRKSNYAFSILYQPALMATKTSILAFYLTFSKANHIFRWACYSVLFVVNAGGFALTMVTVFQCNPISAVFALVTPEDAKCTDILTIYLASVPLNIITDLAILFLPMPTLTSMRLPRKQKIILVVTFSFGIFVAVVDIVRISYLQSASETRLAELASSRNDNDLTRTAEETDASFYLAFSFMWSAIEVTVGIMCACVPGLKPLVARFMPNMLRDPGDAPSQFGSYSMPKDDHTHAAPLPSPEEVHHHDMGRAPEHGDEHEEREMDFMEFLTTPRDFARPVSNEQQRQGEADVGMMDFLTTPDMASLPPIERSQTALTNTTRHTAPDAPAFFDFVDMRQKKSLVHLTNRESIYPVTLVTVLFFIWGFEYGLIDTLNHQYQTVANTTTGQSLGIRCAYYVGYFVGPLLVGRWVLQHWGFKACYPIGLAIYAAGCLIFWPAAVLTSWPTLLVTNFIVGFGLSILEVSANPFIVLCGPAEYAEIRLNLSQGVQAIGSIIAPLIADKAFYHKTQDAPSLVNTQWAYLGISLATIIMAVIYYYVPLSEATDVELEDAAERIDGANKAKVGNVRVIWIVLGLGVVSQFCYVGAQEVNGTSFGPYLAAVAPTYNIANYLAIAHTAFAISRFLAAALGFWVKPRLLLLLFFSGAILFNALCTHFTGDTAVALMIMVFFCEGPLFSLIYAQALRGQGRHTKFAAVLITSAISGGAVFSPISSTIVNSGRSVPYSLVVAIAAFAGAIVFGFALNGNEMIRRLVDPIDGAAASGSRPSSTSSRVSRALSILSFGKKKRNGSGSKDVEYRERKVDSPTPLNEI
ncbi:L-fucose-proton symporter [Fulvia fulva]|uniref:L-fucose-proton symporter n=1 Tax=Passalora fulva TaxID=5499 RepID=A0A9Q8PLC6_PASFU|nr:L-fucose-proton symporter [Fulvia fulva]KAK4610073.1 L-fucose-proton symporter [Fulvia fulva]KAK4610831.1 L-fucose-proton symporter [Fulvia fulva]UJO24517.1 L-fucose-proton symporter [Fulvia fulva]WPV22205.1 L-fucose-proton symporter [Fulvia fulva]WPV36923.1 L-fucose-proton symporter [Fulvia fulva]